MKKTIFFVLALIIVSSVVFVSAQQNNLENKARLENNLATQTQARRNLQNESATPQKERVMVQVGKRLKAKTAEEAKEIIRERREEMNQQIEALKETKKQIHQNQNRVRLAVHSLLAMEDLVGGIGPQVSEIARGFNNSVQSTIRAEEKIQTRWGLTRFLFGGNKKATEEIEQKTNQNRQRIQQLKQLIAAGDFSEEVKAMMQEQTQNMEQEQDRLQQVAKNEKKNKGIFGWLWK